MVEKVKEGTRMEPKRNVMDVEVRRSGGRVLCFDLSWHLVLGWGKRDSFGTRACWRAKRDGARGVFVSRVDGGVYSLGVKHNSSPF